MSSLYILEVRIAKLFYTRDMDNTTVESHRSKTKRKLLGKIFVRLRLCSAHSCIHSTYKLFVSIICENYLYLYTLSRRFVDHWKFLVVGRRKRSYRAASPRITARRFSPTWTAIFWTPLKTQDRVRARRSALARAAGPPEHLMDWPRAIRRRRLSHLWPRPRCHRRRRRATPLVDTLPVKICRRCHRNLRSEESWRGPDWPSIAALWAFSRKKALCQTARKPITRKLVIICWWETLFRTK